MIEYSKQLAENIAQLGQSDTAMAFTLLRAFGEEIDRLEPRQFPSDLRLPFLKLRDKARQYGRMNGFANTEIPSFVAMGREAISIFAAYEANASTIPSEMASDPVHENNMLNIFISHSGKDERLAAALIDLIIAATNVSHEKIRCTSVDGYRLPGGANTDEQLKQEIRDSKCFIGLLTPNSLRSPYVMFELGARWGAELQFIPLMAKGTTSRDLERPLSLLNALAATSSSQLHQFLRELAEHIGTAANSPAVYQGKLDGFQALAAIPIENPNAEFEPQKSELPPLSESAKEILQLIQSEPNISDRGIVLILQEIEPGIAHFFPKLEYSGSPQAAKSRPFKKGLQELVEKGWLHPGEDNPSTNTRTYEYREQ